MAQFDQLSDLDFEEFVADLVSADTGLKFRIGGWGRDWGIDALSVDGKRHVIQCKHYRESSFSQLKAAARKEAGRLEGLDEPFGSYRFATSKPLSHDRWEILVEILEPWLESPEHVLGGNDLGRLLKDNSTVERRHPKPGSAARGRSVRCCRPSRMSAAGR